MPRSPTTTTSSVDEPQTNANANSNSASSTRSLYKRSSRPRFSFQSSRPPKRARTDSAWEPEESQGMFNLVGDWFRSLRSKRSKREKDDSESTADARSASPPRLPELGLEGARLELLTEEPEFSAQR